jgi:ribosomal protein S18 acetylase RimI-like enzyme
MDKRLKTHKIKKRSVLLINGQTALIRPLLSGDTEKITKFLSELSDTTRHFYVLDNYGKKTANSLCSSVSKPEKMHFVAESTSFEMMAIVKFSLDLPENDRLRFRRYDIDLVPGTVSRCGTCIADNYQNLGLGGITLQQIINTSRQLGQEQIMLSGGIFAENKRAIHMVQNYGFRIVGRFIDQQGQEHVDLLRSA